MGGEIKFSVAMIVRDCADNLRRCLASIHNKFGDELIVVEDTDTLIIAFYG